MPGSAAHVSSVKRNELLLLSRRPVESFSVLEREKAAGQNGGVIILMIKPYLGSAAPESALIAAAVVVALILSCFYFER